MHAHCVELLRGHLRPGARVLDVGSGSGYLTAVMALMVGDGGKVVGVDMYPELVEQSVRNVSAALPRLLDGGVVEVRPALHSCSAPSWQQAARQREEEPCAGPHPLSGRAGSLTASQSRTRPTATQLRAGNVLGGALQGEAPFDAIHVGAAAATLPDVLVDRLRPGGRMVVPVGPQWSHQVLQVRTSGRGRRPPPPGPLCPAACGVPVPN